MTTIRSSLASQVPQTQNTAPVSEFRCLYTHDLRRKAKRWQDGFLRYHTFNRRVMVYDVARNFIGDTYHTTGGDLEEGDELDLDKHFALVQVSESLGTTHTDLTELMQSRKRDKAAVETPLKSRPSTMAPVAAGQKHRSLTAMLGTPKGPIGKASLPVHSPFEQRQMQQKARTAEPPSKRRKVDQSPHFPSSGPSASLMSGHSSPVPPSRPRASAKPTPAPQPKPREVIDLCSDNAHHSPVRKPHPRQAPNDALNDSANRHMQNASGQTGANGHARGKSIPKERLRTAPPGPAADASQDQRQPLRVISNGPRRMLLCQQQPNVRKKAAQGEATPEAKTTTTETATKPLAPHEQRLKDRLAQIGRRKTDKILLASTPREPPDEERTPIVHATVPRPIVESPRTSKAPDAATATPIPAPLTRSNPVEIASSPPQPHAPPDALLVSKDLARTDQAPAEMIQGDGHPPAPSMRVIAQSRPPDGPLVAATEAPEPGRNGSSEQNAASKCHFQPATHVAGQADPASKPFKQPRPRQPPQQPPQHPPSIAVAAPPVTVVGLSKSLDPLDRGPWSREAFDLFDYWPPDRDKQGHQLQKVT